MLIEAMIKVEFDRSLILFAMSTFTKILILIHFLGCIFIYIGSERFSDYEEEHTPWIMANEHFREMSPLHLIIFSNYWVCTVVTTVGYGVYNANTSIEYIFTLMIEFFGFVIFAAL